MPNTLIGTVQSLWTWLWGRYNVLQNVFLVCSKTRAYNKGEEQDKNHFITRTVLDPLG